MSSERQLRYQKTEKGKKVARRAQSKYRQSEKGKARTNRYLTSEKGKLLESDNCYVAGRSQYPLNVMRRGFCQP